MRKVIIVLFALVNLLSQEPINLKESLSENVLNEINILSKELKEKTGITASVLVSNEESFDKLKLKAKEQKNFATIVMSLRDKKLDVISDLGLDYRSVTEYYYLKYGFFPTQGAILPLLTYPKGKDVINTSILNGFAELCSVIADSKNVKLENGFSNLNSDIINTLRMLFYIFVIIFIIVLIKRKVKKR